MSRKCWLIYNTKDKLGPTKAICFDEMEELEVYMIENKDELNYLDIAKSIQNY